MKAPDNRREELPFRVCLLGAATDTGNRGVSALASALVANILQVRPKAEISMFVGNRLSVPQTLRVNGRPVSIDVANYRWSPKSRLGEHLVWLFLVAGFYRALPLERLRERIVQSNPRLQTLARADWIGDIRGGDSFSDIYGWRRFVFGSLPALVVLLMGKELVLLPQTIGPFKSRSASLLARHIVRRSETILARDRPSLELARSLAAPRGDAAVRFCPDVAFTLDAQPPRGAAIPAASRPPDGLLVGLNVNGLLYHGGFSGRNMFGLRMDYRRFVHELIRRLLEDPSTHVLLIPHTYGANGDVDSDPPACREVMRSVSETERPRVHLITAEYDAHELKGVIGLCDSFVGSRMHACIAALSQGIPTIGVAYSRKFTGVFESIGLENLVVDARLADEETAIRTILHGLGEREKLAHVIRDRVDKAKETIRISFHDLLLDRHPAPSMGRPAPKARHA